MLENIIKNGKNFAKRMLGVGIITLASFGIGCSLENDPVFGTPAAVSSNARILSQDDLKKILSVSPDKILFSQPVYHSAGDMLVSGISKKTPEGFLRKITKISDDKKLVYTEQAALEEILKSGTFKFEISPPSGEYELVTPEGTFKAVHNKGSLNVNFDFKDRVLYDVDGNKNTKNDQVVLDGEVNLHSKSFLDCQIKNNHVNNLSFENKSEIESTISVKTSLLNLIKKEMKIAEHKFPAFNAGFIPGTLVPLIVRPVLEINVGVEGKLCPIDTSLSHKLSFDSGVSYKNNKWDKHSNFSDSFDFSSPNVSSILDLRAYISPRLNFLLYGVAGPYGEIDTSLSLNVKSSDWTLDGKLEAVLGINTKVFSKILDNVNVVIADYTKNLAKGGEVKETRTAASQVQKIQEPTKEDIKVYAEVVNYNIDIFVEINGEKKALTKHYSNELAPSLSPNKRRVAFNSDRNDEFAVYVIDIDGTNLKKIGNIDESQLTSSPDWSPDSRSVRYTLWVPERRGSIVGLIREGYLNRYEVDVETGKEFVDRSGLLKILNEELKVLKEKIEKDSSNKNNEITQIELLEMQIKNIKEDPKRVVDVYSSCVNYGKENQNYDIYANFSGSGGNETQRLISDLSNDILPLLSPDKNKVIFNSDRDGKFAMYVINVDGTDLRKIYEFGNKEEYDKDYRRWKNDESIVIESLDKTKRTIRIQ